VSATSVGRAASVLARDLGVRAEDHSQFSARVRNLFRIGVMTSGSGRGRAIALDAEQMLRLCIAVQINLFGINPERIPGMLSRLGTVWLNPISVELDAAHCSASARLLFAVPSNILDSALRDRDAMLARKAEGFEPAKQVAARPEGIAKTPSQDSSS